TGHTSGTEPLIVTTHRLHPDFRGYFRVDFHRPVRSRGAVVQPPQPLQRGEAPVLLLAVRDLEVRDIVGGHPLAAGRLGGPRRPFDGDSGVRSVAAFVYNRLGHLSRRLLPSAIRSAG